MRVKDLIEELNKFDGDLKISFYLSNVGLYEPNVKMIREQEKNERDMHFLDEEDKSAVIVYLG